MCGAAGGAGGAALDHGAALRGWGEDDFLRRCDAAYCNLAPPPRSTIAIAFSPDGALLASTQYASPARDYNYYLIKYCCQRAPHALPR